MCGPLPLLTVLQGLLRIGSTHLAAPLRRQRPLQALEHVPPLKGPLREFDDSKTHHIGTHERMRAESGRGGAAQIKGDTVPPTTLTAELLELCRKQRSGDPLEVVASCVRQGESALIHMRHRELVWPVTLFPAQRLYHLTRPIIPSLEQGTCGLEVVAVEPPVLWPPGHPMAERVADPAAYRPLPDLLWWLALRSSRVLPFDEIAGRVAYRLTPDFKPDASAQRGAIGRALQRLRLEVASLPDIAGWPGMDRARTARMLNGVHLQGGLMVLRTHRAAHAQGGLTRGLLEWWRDRHPTRE